MAGEWEDLTLGDLGRIVTGKTPLTAVEGNFGGQIPFVTPSDMDGRRTISTTARYLTESGAASVKGSKIPAGSVMVSCIGSDMGKAIIAGCDCVTNQQINSIVVDDRFSSEFVYYNLSTRKDEIRHQAAGGSAQPILNKGDFSRLEIALPPLAEQKAIAAVLGALDDKIELNRRMNATLEAMARALFQSWFVDFDPVRAKLDGRPPAALDPATAALFPDTFQDSPIGQIPQGWKAGKLREFMQVGIGGAWGEEVPTSKMNVEVRCLRGIDCHDLAERKLPQIPVRHLSERQFADRKLKEGCILVEGSGSFCGRSMVWLPEFERLVGDSVCYSNFCKRLDPLCSPGQALVCWMQLRAANDTGELANFRTGTAFPNFDIHGALLGLDVVFPPKEVCGRYANLYRSWLRLDLVQESGTLATLRYTLLPKLLSGELSAAGLVSKREATR